MCRVNIKWNQSICIQNETVCFYHCDVAVPVAWPYQFSTSHVIHTANSFHIVNLFKGFFNMHTKTNSCYIMQKWNLLFSSSSSSSMPTLFSSIKRVVRLQLVLLFSLNGHWHFRASKAWCWLAFRYDHPSLSVAHAGICLSYDIRSYSFCFHFVYLFIFFLTKMKWYQIGFKCVAFEFHELWYVLLQSMCSVHWKCMRRDKIDAHTKAECVCVCGCG